MSEQHRTWSRAQRGTVSAHASARRDVDALQAHRIQLAQFLESWRLARKVIELPAHGD